jgi:hypothetical protein
MREWLQQVAERERLNFNAANTYGSRHYQLGIPVLALTALAASPAVIELERAATGWPRIAVSLVRVMVPVFVGLQTFLHLSERAEKHRLVAARYGAIKRHIEEVMAFFAADLRTTEKVSAEIRGKIDAAEAEEPPIPGSIFRRSVARPKGPATKTLRQ